MAITKYKPTSPGRRGMSTQDFGDLTQREPEVKLLEHKPDTAGRNNYGRITSRFRGGGHKQRYRKIDFKRAKTGVLDFFFATYVARNAKSPIGFLEWVDTEYNRLELHARFREEGWASLIVDKVLHRE